MAFLLKTDGTIQEVKPAQGESFALAELQAMVCSALGVRKVIFPTDEVKPDGYSYYMRLESVDRWLSGQIDRMIEDTYYTVQKTA